MLGIAVNKRQKTKNKIQLGVGVTNPYGRHLAVFERAVATVDEISHERVKEFFSKI